MMHLELSQNYQIPTVQVSLVIESQVKIIKHSTKLSTMRKTVHPAELDPQNSK